MDTTTDSNTFNRSCHYKMTLLKYLNILTFLVLTITSTASCQNNRNNETENSTAQNLRSFRQIFWDSIPQPVGYINDYEDLFSDVEEKSLDCLIEDFEKRTTIQITVVTIDTTMTTPDSLDALTLRIANAWGVGQKEKNNGVVIGISKGYRKMRIQNGYGIEKMLTDAETKKIIDTAFIPYYREAEYFKGTFKGLQALMATLKKRDK